MSNISSLEPNCGITSVDVHNFVIVQGILYSYNGSNAEVLIPAGVHTIWDKAFEGCHSLISIIIPEGVTAIGKEAFLGCKNLMKVSISESVTTIGDKAFCGCVNLTEVTLPSAVGALFSKVFPKESAMKIRIEDISTLPSKYKLHAVLCFAADNGCGSDIRFGSHTKYIKTNAGKLIAAAMENPALLSLMCREKLIAAKLAPAYLEAAQADNNVECIALMMDYIANKLTSKKTEPNIKRKKTESDTVIDRKILCREKEKTEGFVFAVTGNLETFQNRNELQEFITAKGGKLAGSISAKVDYLIMNDADSDTAKKKKAEELGIDIITEREFNEKAGRRFLITDGHILKKYTGKGGDVIIPDVVTKVAVKAFECCNVLHSITIPASVTQIGSEAFRCCTSLRSVTISDSITEIESNTFCACRSLTSITLPSSVTEIGWFAFCDCTSLAAITIPASVKEIGANAFYNCTSLSAVTIPESVTRIGQCAFMNCISLTSATIPEGVSEIDCETFRGCTSLEAVTIPNSVREIYWLAFEDCPTLTIHAPAGSYAETYAKENNIPFVAE